MVLEVLLMGMGLLLLLLLLWVEVVRKLVVVNGGGLLFFISGVVKVVVRLWCLSLESLWGCCWCGNKGR